MKTMKHAFLKDYVTAQDRMARHHGHGSMSPLHPANRELIVAYVKGIIVIGASLLLWLISDGIVARMIGGY